MHILIQRKFFSDLFSIIKNPNENYKYIFTYIVQNSTNYYLVYKIGYFSPRFITEKDISIKVSKRRCATCFLTEQLKHICFFESESKEFKTMVHNIDFETSGIESIIYTPKNSSEVGGEKQFFKGIHLKKEIGFFIYYKEKADFPTISLYSCNSDLLMVPYSNFKDITFEKGTYKKDNVINDIIKLNDDQICFVSTDNSKHYFNIIVYSLYNDDKSMKISHYILEMWQSHNHKIFSTIKINLYKQFLSIAYSHCPQVDCSSDGRDEHHCSLIILGYPNSTESSLDVIPELYNNNKNLENDYCFYFENKTYIENNLFGLVVKGVKIINYPKDEIILKNSSSFDAIQNDTIVLKDECVTLSFPTHDNDNYEVKNYIIEIAYVLTEPSYNYKNAYINDTETFGENIENEEQYYLHHDFFGKHTQFTLNINNKLTTNCEDYCLLCYFNNKSCIACMYDYGIKDNEKICYPKPTKPTEYIEADNNSGKIENIYECTKDEILNDECNNKLTSEQIGDIYSFLSTKINKDSNELIKTENAIFQISTLEEQKNNNDPDTSSIDIGDCEKILKEKEGLGEGEDEDLIIFKIDIKSEDLSKTYVQYEIYNPRNLSLISLDECKGSSISISVPVNLDESTISIYDNLQKSGYNLFNLNDSFYNDICSTYTTEDGTDLTLSDRKNLIYNNNANTSMCQEGCTFQSYDISTKKSECSCNVQDSKTVTDITKLNFDEYGIKDAFFHTLNNSNFRVLKCYKLVFSKNGQKNNIGSYIMSGICFLFIVLMIIYIFNDHLKINTYIKNILISKINSINLQRKNSDFSKQGNNKKVLIKNKNDNLSKNKSNDNKNKSNDNKNKSNDNKNKSNDNKNKNNNNKNKNKSNDKNKKTNKSNKTNKNNKNKKNENENKNKSKGKKNENKIKTNKKENNMRISVRKSLKKGNKKHNFPPKRKSISNNYKDISKKTLEEYASSQKAKSKTNLLLLKEKNFQIEKRNLIKNSKSPKKVSTNLSKINDLEINNKNLNDEELNNLEYELATIIDKRTFFQYYFSLLKKKQLILFAFLPSNDYNLVVIKLALFLLSFSLYFTVNGFFFSDATMNKINEDKGEFNLLFQIPQILYSSVISAVINVDFKTIILNRKANINYKTRK